MPSISMIFLIVKKNPELLMDQYPYREDGYGAIKSGVLYLQKLEAILENEGMKK